MSRPKLNVNKKMGKAWKRNTSLGRPIGRSAKPTEKRKRKRKARNMNAALQEASVELDENSQISVPQLTNAAAIALPNDKFSLGSKVTNKTSFLNCRINGTLDSTSARNNSALFHSLCYSEDVLSALPNRTWAIHSTETPQKHLVVSSMIMYSTDSTGPVPVYIKQIIFDERLNFDILLVNSRIVLKDKPTSISTMHDFEDLLDYVDSLKVCTGGPPISQYGRVNPECAYRDSMNNWRHNLCSLEITNGDVCESCNSLDEILRRHAQRNGTMVKSAGKRKR